MYVTYLRPYIEGDRGAIFPEIDYFSNWVDLEIWGWNKCNICNKSAFLQFTITAKLSLII